MLRGNERILDLGCGDGSITRQLADRVPRGSVVADPLLKMVAPAKAFR